MLSSSTAASRSGFSRYACQKSKTLPLLPQPKQRYTFLPACTLNDLLQDFELLPFLELQAGNGQGPRNWSPRPSVLVQPIRSKSSINRIRSFHFLVIDPHLTDAFFSFLNASPRIDSPSNVMGFVWSTTRSNNAIVIGGDSRLGQTLFTVVSSNASIAFTSFVVRLDLASSRSVLRIKLLALSGWLRPKWLAKSLSLAV